MSVLKSVALIIEISIVSSSANFFCELKTMSEIHLIFGLQKFFIYCFKAISYIKTVIKIIKIMRTKTVNLKNINTHKSLTRQEQYYRHR